MLNNPISSISAAASAVRVAGSVLGKAAGSLADTTSSLAEGTPFADVLAGSHSPPVPDLKALVSQLTEKVSAQLESLGISAASTPRQEMPEIEVDSSGRMRVVGDHRRAAEIEAVLAGDPQATALAAAIRSAEPGGVVLTPGQTDTNIHAGSSDLVVGPETLPRSFS